MADSEVHDPSRDPPADSVSHVGIGPVSESPAGKEAKVEEENGELDAGERGLVGSLESKACLTHVSHTLPVGRSRDAYSAEIV